MADTRRTLTLDPIEAEYLQQLQAARDAAQRDFNLAFTMACGARGIRIATFVGIEGLELHVHQADGVPVESDA